MEFTYASGKVDSGTGEFASITRSGFAGNLSINISGNFNAIIKRNTAGLVIYDSNGKASGIVIKDGIIPGNGTFKILDDLLKLKHVPGIYGIALTVLILIGAFILRRIPPMMKEGDGAEQRNSIIVFFQYFYTKE